MLLVEKIKSLNWYNFLNKIKDILLELFLNGRTYKVYRALISQEGDNDPTAIVLENTLGIELNWTRYSQGQYTTQANLLLNEEKTFYIINPTFTSDEAFVQMYFLVGQNKLNITTANTAQEETDSYLYFTPIEIKIYP